MRAEGRSGPAGGRPVAAANAVDRGGGLSDARGGVVGDVSGAAEATEAMDTCTGDKR